MSELDVMLEKLDAMLEKLDGLEQGMAALQDAMGMVLEACAPPATTPQAPTKAPIASYEQMYGPIVAAPVIESAAPPAPPRPGRLRHWRGAHGREAGAWSKERPPEAFLAGE